MARLKTDRQRNLRVNVNDGELAMLHALAAAAGVTSSDVVRLLIREAHGRLDTKPTKTRSKR